MDETLGLPTEQAVKVALRTQQILAHETGVTRVVDPLGGSWFVEQLTDTMEAEALDYIAEIDDMGGGAWPKGRAGVVNGINKGYFRRQIAEASYRFSEECEAGDRLIVGVNAYRDENETRDIEILAIPHEVEVTQVDRLTEFKNRRDDSAVNDALDSIRSAARKGENVMPSLVEGALANCTLGEMVQAMADIYGRYTGGPEW
jgi:methylmalonyl-CoA mutase N-terminal domain/subunit